jgi:hypothetical protein
MVIYSLHAVVSCHSVALLQLTSAQCESYFIITSDGRANAVVDITALENVAMDEATIQFGGLFDPHKSFMFLMSQ